MLEIRPLTLAVLVSSSCAIGAAGAAWGYERKIDRLHAERDGYLSLANATAALSEKSINFALSHQDVLESCMTRLYTPTAMEDLPTSPHKGGIGGPRDVWRKSRLP